MQVFRSVKTSPARSKKVLDLEIRTVELCTPPYSSSRPPGPRVDCKDTNKEGRGRVLGTRLFVYGCCVLPVVLPSVLRDDVRD